MKVYFLLFSSVLLLTGCGFKKNNVQDQRGNSAELDPIRTSANATGYDPVECDPLYLHDGVCDEPDADDTADQGADEVEPSSTDTANDRADDTGNDSGGGDSDSPADEPIDPEPVEPEPVDEPEDDPAQPEPTGPKLVEFRIEAGTGGEAWNDAASMVEVKVGDTLRIHNDDNVDHRLHTNGRPCDHGSNIAPGESFDCVISDPVEPGNSPPTYDHNFGRNASFFVRATPAD